MNFFDVVAVLRLRWKTLVLVAVLCVAAAAGLAAAQTPEYQSSTQLLASSARDNSTEAYQGGLYSAQRVQSYAKLAASTDTAQSVIEATGLRESPRTLARHVTASVLPDTLVLQVSVRDTDPKRADRLASAYAAVVIDAVAEVETPAAGMKPLVKVAVIDRSGVPTAPVSPNWLVFLVIGLFLGLVLGVVAALVRHLVDNRVSDPDEAAALVDGPVLGVLGRRTSHDADDGFAAWSPGDAEALRLLRTNLVFADVGREHGVYVVSSPIPGDGKTMTALNLARVLALTGRRVLLVDADLRKPTVATRAGLDASVGLTSVLVGAVTLEAATQPTRQAGLSVLTAGPVPPNPAELLQTPAMAEVLASARSDYDVTVIDSAPLLPVSDTAALATETDGVLVVARHRTSTRQQLVRTRERLESVGATLLGVVLNDVPHKGLEGYGYGYGYDGPADPVRRAPAAPADEPAETGTDARV